MTREQIEKQLQDLPSEHEALEPLLRDVLVRLALVESEVEHHQKVIGKLIDLVESLVKINDILISKLT